MKYLFCVYYRFLTQNTLRGVVVIEKRTSGSPQELTFPAYKSLLFFTLFSLKFDLHYVRFRIQVTDIKCQAEYKFESENLEACFKRNRVITEV